MKKMSEDTKISFDYHDYHEIDYPAIGQALQKIDAARYELTAAQNNLVKLLDGIESDYTLQRFREFYTAGGVTASDWEANYNSHKDRYLDPQPIKVRGQLRVVGREPWLLSDPVKPPERYRLKQQMEYVYPKRN